MYFGVGSEEHLPERRPSGSSTWPGGVCRPLFLDSSCLDTKDAVLQEEARCSDEGAYCLSFVGSKVGNVFCSALLRCDLQSNRQVCAARSCLAQMRKELDSDVCPVVKLLQTLAALYLSSVCEAPGIMSFIM